MALPIVMAAIAGGAALAKGISGAVQASKARKALEGFQRQELKNITEGMRVSTLGAELQTQEAQRRFATSVDALRSGGVRGVVGGLGQQEQLQQRQQQQISADLDRQQQQIEMMRAQDEARIQGMQEQRESFDIGRLAGQQAAGRAQLSSAIGDVAGLATSFISPAGMPTPKDNTTLLSQPGTVRGDISAGSDAVKGEYNRIEALRRNAESYGKLGTGRGAEADLMGLKALAKNLGHREIDKPSFLKRIF
jgi:hypothetical protein